MYGNQVICIYVCEGWFGMLKALLVVGPTAGEKRWVISNGWWVISGRKRVKGQTVEQADLTVRMVLNRQE